MCSGYAAALANYMQSNPECFDPSRVVAGYSNCNVNVSAYSSACSGHSGLICQEHVVMSKATESVSMDVSVCVPLTCSQQDIYIMLQTAADSECEPDQFVSCSVDMCGVSYEYTPTPKPVCNKGVSSGAAAGLAISMLFVGGAISAGIIWWLYGRRITALGVNAGTFSSSVRSTSYTDL